MQKYKILYIFADTTISLALKTNLIICTIRDYNRSLLRLTEYLCFHFYFAKSAK